MRFIKKTASIISSLIIILAIGGYFFVRNFDLNRYKSYIQDIVLRETGRTLALKGDAKLGISLVPTVEINDVTFSNPSWAQNKDMVRLQKLEVKFAILPLLNKKIEINKLILLNPEIYLEKSLDGVNSWDFASKSEQENKNIKSDETRKIKSASSALAVGLIAEEVEIKNGVVNYYDAKTQDVKQFALKELLMDIPSDEKPIKLKIDAFLDGKEFDIKAEVSSLTSLLNNARADFKIKANITNVAFDLSGAIEDVIEYPRYAIVGNLYNPAGNLNVVEISADIMVDGDINSADVLLKNVDIADNEVKGAAKIDWSKQKPEINSTLSSQVFNVASLNSQSILSFKTPELINSAQALQIVPKDIVPYQYLKMFNGNFDINIAKLVFSKDMSVNDVVLSAKLKDGNLDISKLKVRIGDNNLNSNININANNENITLKAVGDNIKVQDLYTPLYDGKNGGLQVIDGGNVTLDVNLSMNGNTYQKLSETVNGQIVAIVDKSEIKTGKMKWFTEGVLSKIFSLLGINTAKSTNMDVACAVVRADIKNGVANFPSGVVFDASKLKLVSNGTINMVNDKIDFTIAPTLNKLADGNITQALASFVKIAGTLSNPELKLDKAATLTTVLGSIMSGGAYLGTEILFNDDETPCYVALMGTKYASRFPEPKGVKATTKNVYQDVNKQVKDAVKELGGVAKDLLGVLRKQ